MFNIEPLLDTIIKNQASDLHLIGNNKPSMRLKGRIVPIGNYEVIEGNLLSKSLLAFLEKVATKEEYNKFLEEKELDFAFEFNKERFRANFAYEQGFVTGTFRYIQSVIPSFESLGLNPILKDLISQNSGLILVTGPTGVGKTTTLASLLNEINKNTAKKIITIEEPIEYKYKPIKSLIIQRGVGVDTKSFANGLKHSLRQDPDIILVGEIRDKETAEIALQAAQTGHLVFATIHTNNSFDTINRILDFFSFEESNKIRNILSSVLISVISQILANTKDDKRICVQEILVCNNDIKNFIRKNELNKIYSYMQSSSLHKGCTLNSQLSQLVKKFFIDKQQAFELSYNKEELQSLVF